MSERVLSAVVVLAIVGLWASNSTTESATTEPVDTHSRPAVLVTINLRTGQRLTDTNYASKMGVELDGLGDGMRSRPFVDAAVTLRPWPLQPTLTVGRQKTRRP